MSQRSHIAKSGSSAIIECSAAWSEPSSLGSASNPSSCASDGTYQTASVSNSVSGRSSATRSIASCVVIRRRWYATTRSVTTTEPKQRSSPQRRSRRRSSRIDVSLSCFAIVYQSPRNGETSAARRRGRAC